MTSWAIIEARLNNVSAKTCHTVIAMIIPSFLQQQKKQYEIHLPIKKYYRFLENLTVFFHKELL